MKSLESSIPTRRLVLYSVLLSLLPIILSYLYVNSMLSEARNSLIELSSIQEKIATTTLHQQSNRHVMARYKNADPLFVHKKIESLPLMEGEIARLEEHLAKSALPDDSVLEKRLQTLLRAENRCIFLETSREESPGYKQVLESMSRPVEMGNADVERVLTYLEGDDEDKPHLIISEAQFERKKSNVGDSWNVLLKIIRREYTP